MIRWWMTVLAGIVSCGGNAKRASSSTPSGEHAERHEGRAHHEHHHHHHGHHAFTDAEAWAKVFDDPARDEWQHPDEVLRALELEPHMNVADLGAGTGYFALRLARAVPHGQVFATDIEPDMVRFLGERATREGVTNLRPVRATAVSSGLAPASVDRILVVNVWHHLDGRVEYARQLGGALRPGGRLVIVEFGEAARRGPPASMRIAPRALIDELEKAGFTANVSAVTLPDQYIVVARRSV